MTKTRRRFPESFKRVTVKQTLTSTALRHLADTLGITESLLSRTRQYKQQGDDAFGGNGKQHGESSELRRLRQQLGSGHYESSLCGCCEHIAAVSIPASSDLLGEICDAGLRFRLSKRWRLFSTSRHD